IADGDEYELNVAPGRNNTVGYIDLVPWFRKVLAFRDLTWKIMNRKPALECSRSCSSEIVILRGEQKSDDLIFRRPLNRYYATNGSYYSARLLSGIGLSDISDPI